MTLRVAGCDPGTSSLDIVALDDGAVVAQMRFAGLSFAHLQEILRLSGLLTIYAGRATRDAEDVQRAAQMVRDACDAAAKGFAGSPEVPFGLAPRRRAAQL